MFLFGFDCSSLCLFDVPGDYRILAVSILDVDGCVSDSQWLIIDVYSMLVDVL